jgi:hypothetical protein
MANKRPYVKPDAVASGAPAAELLFLEEMIQELKEYIEEKEIELTLKRTISLKKQIKVAALNLSEISPDNYLTDDEREIESVVQSLEVEIEKKKKLLEAYSNYRRAVKSGK